MWKINSSRDMAYNTSNGDVGIAQILTAHSVAEINAAGGIVEWVAVPTAEYVRHYAYHPIIFKARLWTGEDAAHPAPLDATKKQTDPSHVVWWSPSTVQTIAFELRDGDGLLRAVMEVDTLEGYATFDVSGYVRTWFDEHFVERVRRVTIDTALFTLLRVSVDDGVELVYLIMNAVSQVGSDGEKDTLAPKVLNDGRVLYEGGMSPEVTIAFYGDADIYGTTYVGPAVARVPVTTQTEFDALGLGELGFVFVPYPECASPASAVRWLSRKGAVEVFQFANTKFKIKSADTDGLAGVYAENYEDIHTNRRPLGVKGERLVRLGAEGVTTEELDLLTKLPYSPQIEWYDEANGLWTGVTVKGWNDTEAMDAARHDFEIELLCPAINTQFE